MPRNCVALAHAFAMRPFSACVSIRRCPSIRLIGSTTTLVLAMAALLLLGLYHGKLAPLARLVDARGDRMRRDTRRRAHRQAEPDGVRGTLDGEPAHVGQAAVERGHRVPEPALGATDARVARADGPAGARVPLEDRAGGERRRALAAHVIQAPALAGALIVERLDVLAGVEVRAPLALIVDPGAVREHRAAISVEIWHAAEREEVHDGRSDHVADRRATRDVHHRLVL